MKRLFSYMRRHWLKYTFGILATFLTATFANFIPMLIRNAVDAAQGSHRAALAHNVELIAMCAIIMGCTRWLSRVVVFNTGAAPKYLEALPADLPSIDKDRVDWELIAR